MTAPTPLAWRIYPEPHGTAYSAEALADPRVVEEVFDYCQILEAAIYPAGWDFLLRTHSRRQLFEINRRSGWFDGETEDEVIAQMSENAASSQGSDG